MDYKLSKLPSGLRVLTVPMPASESVTLAVWVKTGSRNEDIKKLGVSHFLEHMVFKGSNKYPTMRELFEVFDTMGAEHNAATSKEWTNFWVKLPVNDMERGFDVLSDVVLHPLLDVKEAERERKVIFEEMKMYEDTPMRKIVDIFEELIYDGNPLGWDTIGTVESVGRIDRNDFLDYRNQAYFGRNILVSAAGGISEASTLSLAGKYFSKIPVDGLITENMPFAYDQSAPKFRLRSKKTDQAHFILGFLSQGRGYKNRFPQAVMAGILGGGGSSRFWTEVREKRGLAYAVSGSLDRYSDAGYFGVYVGTGVSKSDEAVRVILDQVYGLAEGKYKISDAEMGKVKGYLKGRFALQLENSEVVNDYFSEQVLFDKEVLTPEEVFEKIDKVSAAEVVAEAKKIFVKKNLNFAIIGPYKDEVRFRKLLD